MELLMDIETIKEKLEYPNKIFSSEEILADPCPIESESGFYAVWFDDFPKNSLTIDRKPLIMDIDKCVKSDNLVRLYIGIGKLTENRRGVEHRLTEYVEYHDNPRGVDSSRATLKKSLGVLLGSTSDLELIQVNGRKHFSDDHERWLTNWIRENCFFSVVLYEKKDIGGIEEEIIQDLSKNKDLPLNINNNLLIPKTTNDKPNPLYVPGNFGEELGRLRTTTHND